MEITREEIALQRIASKDKTRYNIGGVYFNCKHAVATNGHSMIVQRKSEDAPSNTILEFSKTSSKENIKLNRIDDETLVASNGITAKQVEGQYPDYALVFPEKFEKPVSICFSAKLFKELAEVLSTSKTQAVTLQFDSVNPHQPMLLVGDSTNAVGLIMPMREDCKRNPIEELEALKV